MSACPQVSVVIPTRDRRERLAAALDALEQQTLPRAAFEVIVVDDGDGGAVAAADTRRQEGHLAIRAIRSTGAGPAAARNAGAAAARAPILAFLDDDVIPDPQWLAAGLAAFAGERVGAVEGRVRVAPRESIGAFTRLVENERGGRYLSCNLFVRRAAFERAGGFDPRFGPHDFFREDSDLAFTLIEQRDEILFVPDAAVSHPPEPAGIWYPLRQARKYRHDRRLWRKHPARCAQRLDVHRLGPLVIRRPRQRAYVLQAAAIVCGVALMGAGHGAAAAGIAAAGSLPAVALHMVPAVRARRLTALLALPVVAGVSAAAAFVYIATVLWEACAPQARLR